MALTAAQIGRLTNAELLRVADNEQDPLTSSPLDLEITKRLGEAVDALQEHADIHGVLDEYDGLKASELRDLLERVPDGDPAVATALLSVLLEEEQTHADELRKRLRWAERFCDLYEDPDAALEALETLETLATP